MEPGKSSRISCPALSKPLLSPFPNACWGQAARNMGIKIHPKFRKLLPEHLLGKKSLGQCSASQKCQKKADLPKDPTVLQPPRKCCRVLSGFGGFRKHRDNNIRALKLPGKKNVDREKINLLLEIFSHLNIRWDAALLNCCWEMGFFWEKPHPDVFLPPLCRILMGNMEKLC